MSEGGEDMTNGIASETNGIARGANGSGLLECPHCGSVAEYVSEHAKGKRWAVACTMTSNVAAGEGRPMCRCRTPFVRDKGQARDIWNRRVSMQGSDRELVELAHGAWSMALCAMQGMPIPAKWGEHVENGLRGHGIDVDDEKAAFEEDEDEW